MYEPTTYVITGRGARIKHIAADGTAACPSPAAQPATGRFEKLAVCARCTDTLNQMNKEQAAPAAAEVTEEAEEAPAEVTEEAEENTAEEAPGAGEPQTGDEIEIHFSNRVRNFMATSRVSDSLLVAELNAPRKEKCGRGFTAYITTTRPRAQALLADMKKLLAELETGALPKGRKGGMNFQPEAVAKGIEHITACLADAGE